jgi:hypothetical protein
MPEGEQFGVEADSRTEEIARRSNEREQGSSHGSILGQPSLVRNCSTIQSWYGVFGRDRSEDIPRLARTFLAFFARQIGRPVPKLSRGAEEMLLGYDWPGNVRELRNVIERALILWPAQILEPAALRRASRQRQERWGSTSRHCAASENDSLRPDDLSRASRPRRRNWPSYVAAEGRPRPANGPPVSRPRSPTSSASRLPGCASPQVRSGGASQTGVETEHCRPGPRDAVSHGRPSAPTELWDHNRIGHFARPNRCKLPGRNLMKNKTRWSSRASVRSISHAAEADMDGRTPTMDVLQERMIDEPRSCFLRGLKRSGASSTNRLLGE